MADPAQPSEAVLLRLSIVDDKMRMDIVNTFEDVNSHHSQMFTTLAFGLIEATKLDLEYLLELGAKVLFKERHNGDAPSDT